MTGYTASEVAREEPDASLKSGLTPPEVYEDLWRTITAGGSWQGELQNRRKDGSLFWERVQISAVRGPGGLIRNYVAVNEDITERRRAADALKRTQRMLMQSQKMEAIGRLAGGVAHDFNNLLSVILGHSERVREEIGADHPSRGRIDQIAWAAEKAGGLTKQLLAFSRSAGARAEGDPPRQRRGRRAQDARSDHRRGRRAGRWRCRRAWAASGPTRGRWSRS